MSPKKDVIVVTGGADGIGYAITNKFLSIGCKVAIILDTDEVKGLEAVEKLKKLYDQKEIEYIKCDVTKDLNNVYEQINERYKVDVLVNNAGGDKSTPREIIDVNTTALIEFSLKYQELMIANKGGTIINIASIFGYRVIPFAPVYQACKFAVMGFTKSLGHATNSKKTGVRVIALCPGFTLTKATRSLKDLSDELLSKEINKDSGHESSQDITDFASKHEWQEFDVVGNAAIEVFLTANSGTTWLIEGEKLSEIM